MSFHTLPTLQFAVAEISANPPDILITDPLYPSSDGRRLIKAALDAGCGAVIAVSAAAGERAVTDVLDAGCGRFYPQAVSVGRAFGSGASLRSPD